MSNDDEPTTAAEMELLDTIKTVVDEAEELQLIEDLVTITRQWETIGDRVERGELTETERRTLREYLHDALPRAEVLVERARRRANGDQ